LIEGIGCFLAIVVVVVTPLVVKALIEKRRGRDVRVRAARIHSALGRLSRKEGDLLALEEISTVVGNGRWLLNPAMRAQTDLWSRALGFAFNNIGTVDGRRVLETLVVPLTSSLIFEPSSFLRETVKVIRENPNRRDIHGAVEEALRAMPKARITPGQSEWLYHRALEIVKQQPAEADVAVLALGIGRWHCSRARPDGKVTVYDEQMIQNDIAVRRAGV